jgi:hypothetical protein
VANHDGSPAPAYFWHIPKTAGTSIRIWWASCFGDGLCPAGIADELVRMPVADLGRYRAFIGHFHGYLAQYLGRDVMQFTLLRDPIARTRSHWHQVRRAPHHPYHLRVRAQSFAAFVDDDLNRVMIEDYQARYLCTLPIDLAALARTFSDDDLSSYALAETLEQASLPVTKDFLAARARAALGRMAVVGICEQFRDFLIQVSAVLGIPEPEAEPRANITEQDDSGVLPAATLARLHDLTAIDRGLYQAIRRGKCGPASGNRERTADLGCDSREVGGWNG